MARKVLFHRDAPDLNGVKQDKGIDVIELDEQKATLVWIDGKKRTKMASDFSSLILQAAHLEWGSIEVFAALIKGNLKANRRKV